MKTALALVFLSVMVLIGCLPKRIHTPPIISDSPSPAAIDSTISHSPEVGDSEKESGPVVADTSGLSPAGRLMIQSCDNYVQVNQNAPKIPEVLLLKASVYFNSNLFEDSRKVYRQILERYDSTNYAVDAVRMTAQSFYKEQRFERAQKWYRKLRDMAAEEGSRSEAIVRIAESIFRMAEMFESQQQFEKAASQYERIALEFPDSKIADVSLFNAGLCYEKLTQWSRAVLMYQRLKKRYKESELVPKSMFRLAKTHEKMQQWEDAARMYLQLVTEYPLTEYSEASLYNAGFSFQNAAKPAQAAATFEKLAQSFPDSEDAPDVLFKAGELYGQIKDWEAVTRVNTLFTNRYGNDINRGVQAQCMVGVALYMQNKTTDALRQLQKTVATYNSLDEPSTVNKLYAARAQFTIAEIYHELQNKIALTLPRSEYKRLLDRKTSLLDKAVRAYSAVLPFNISEWTTRTIYQIGQIYEDFAMGVFDQQRPKGLDVEQTLSLELGIAKAVEEYFVDHALHYHEQNVKLGLKENIEDRHILNSKRKLTYLPYMAGDNYLALVEIAKNARENNNLGDFALIAQKLQLLQQVAPYQERAIELFLKALELGTMYRETNEFYDKASSLITGTSYTVGKTYAEVAHIAGKAPIPHGFDRYERFVYKTKLLNQIEDYENHALTNYLKGLKIAQAYSLKDEFIEQSKTAIPQLLFQRGRSYDLLCIHSFTNPPFPNGTSPEEHEEYRARFEEIGLRFQEQAFDIYRTILEYAQKDYAQGEYVNHAYVRLYQNYPNEFGVKQEEIVQRHITSGGKWKVSKDSIALWREMEFDDSGWDTADKSTISDSIALIGFPNDLKINPMWYYPDSNQVPSRVYFRRVFYLPEPPLSARLYVAANTFSSVYLNGKQLPKDTSATPVWYQSRSWDLTGKLRQGKNVLALEVINYAQEDYAAIPYMEVKISQKSYLPQLPGTQTTIPKEKTDEGVWIFPEIPNFSQRSKR